MGDSIETVLEQKNNIEGVEEVIEQRLKILIVGEPGAGKGKVAKGTDVCVPFKSLGVSLGKKVNLHKRINYRLTMIFWTLTEGRPKKTTYFNGASGAIIVGNLKKRGSIKKMGLWADILLSQCGWIPIYFVGTLNNIRETKKEENLARLANEYNSDYFMLSSLKGDSLDKIFNEIGQDLAKKHYRILIRSKELSNSS